MKQLVVQWSHDPKARGRKCEGWMRHIAITCQSLLQLGSFLLTDTLAIEIIVCEIREVRFSALTLQPATTPPLLEPLCPKPGRQTSNTM